MVQENSALDDGTVPNLGDENPGQEKTAIDPSILDAGATGEAHSEPMAEQAEAEKPQDEQPRDSGGRFSSDKEPAPSEKPADEQPEVAAAPAHLNSVLVAEATASGYTSEQINGVPTNEMLADLVAGARARNSYSQPPQQPQAAQQPPQYQPPQPMQQQQVQQQYPEQQPTMQPQPMQAQPPQQYQAPQQQPAQTLELKLDDNEVPSEFSGPLKQVQQFVNDLKGSVITENQQLRQALADVQRGVQQSAELAGQAGQQQAAQAGDAIADSVPGLVEAIGKPSQAEFGNNNVARAKWTAIAEVFRPELSKHAERFGYQSVAEVPQTVVRELLKDAATQLGYLGGTNGRANNGQTNRAPQGNRFQNQQPGRVPASNPEDVEASYLGDLMSLVGDQSLANEIGNAYR